MKNYILSSICILLLISNAAADESSTNAKLIAELLPGSYATTTQALEDDYFLDLQLHITPISQKSDSLGFWFYVETAFTSDSLHPYKQQVFNLIPYNLGLVKLIEYSIPNKDQYVNAWMFPEKLDNIQISSLNIKNNCAIIIKKLDETFVGSTTGKGCISNLRGAAFEVTDLEITSKEFYIWNRGYNHEEKQVWGTKDGGYSFLRNK